MLQALYENIFAHVLLTDRCCESRRTATRFSAKIAALQDPSTEPGVTLSHDINSNRQKNRNCSLSLKFGRIDLCTTFGLLQHVREHSHRNGRWLDFVLSMDINMIGVTMCTLTLSDHYHTIMLYHSAAGTNLHARPTTVLHYGEIWSLIKFELISYISKSGLF